MKKLTVFSAIAIAAMALASPSHAQILWGSAQNITGVSDISTAGTAFDAINFSGSALTVNGVTFSNGSDSKISVAGTYDTGAYGAPFSSTPPSSTDYSSLVSAGTFGNQSTGTVTISNLKAGDSYQVESWSYYSPETAATTVLTGSNSVALNNGLGQFAIGAFTAAGATQSYTFSSSTGHNFINVVSVRDVTVAPEPSTWALMLGGLGLLVVCVRRKHVLNS